MPQKRTRVFNQYSNLGLNDVIAGPRCEQVNLPSGANISIITVSTNRMHCIEVTASKQGCVQSYLVPLKDTPGSSERSPAFPERPTSNDQFPAVPISE
ncbi:hypothetical protein HZH68_005177 [Vespula germanica]|uniref:Uncharacterized protein n=1 Tax=Vespula germanica TaxID=30212 RepID=A0A834KFK5_VESGE|nr:hypothetical protein HZH68_005177 [Vespula germanica]